MKNSAFGKTMENLRKHRDIKTTTEKTTVTTEKRRNFFVSEPNYHTKCIGCINDKN